MSRTKKGAKGPGYELWGKRRGAGLPSGRTSKKIYNGQERADAKQALLKEPRTPEYDAREYVPIEPELKPCPKCKSELEYMDTNFVGCTSKECAFTQEIR